MKRRRRILLAALLAAGTAQALWAWPWSRDMVVQIFIRPQQQTFLPPAGSIPLGWEAPRTREQADRELQNPLPASPENLEHGQKLFEMNCFPCHGRAGHGDGPVAGDALVPADLTSARVQTQNDGLLYDTIRHGRASMTAYYDRLSPQERWLVILYVRRLGQQEARR